jgi:prepilin-type N-terminal cleavage/methylation domain-containing protein
MKRRENGFTLVELLVATAVTLLVLGGALTAFRNALAINETASLISDANQNLRAGTNLMTRDLLQAGRGLPTGGIPIPSGGANAIARPGPQGEAYVFDNVTATTLPALVPGPALGPTIGGRPTDLITILTADAALPALTLNPAPAVAGQATLAADGSSLDVGADPAWLGDPQLAVREGDLIMFSNALGNAIQTVTATDATRIEFGAGDPFDLNQRGAAQGTIMQLQNGGAFPQTTATRIVMLTYYVDATSTPGAPRLVRRQNARQAQPLAGIVEDLELSFDLVDGVSNPTDVKDIVLPNTPNQIRKVNLHVGVRSDSRSSQRQDYLRHHVSTVVSVRSLAFVNRYL